MSSTTSPPPTTPPQTTKSPATTAVVAVLAFSGIVVSLMQTLVIPIIPHLPEYLNAPASDTAWAVTATCSPPPSPSRPWAAWATCSANAVYS